MLLSSLHITNYRGLRDVQIPMSRFGCLIGENNAGKSSILQSLTLWRSGTSLNRINFFDDSKEIRIALTLSNITDNDLARLADEHRKKLAALLRDGAITLVRSYDIDGKSRLRYVAKVPKEERFLPANIDSLVKGKKAGKTFASEVMGLFPELKDKVTASMNQGDVRSAIQSFADTLPDEEKQYVDMPLPTGIDESIVALLPEILYIEAVKDLTDEVKTAQSTPFGKILGILLKAVEPKLDEEKGLFEKLNAKLNRVELPDGSIQDCRLDELKLVEATVEKYARESFSSIKVDIAIPPPELKTIFSTAQIYADDGVRGPIETKGDGLRRAIVFSILRSFVELQRSGAFTAGEGSPSATPQYLLLFEEPELYLHPKAQEILFEALSIFSKQHHVLVTTHSPMFFGPEATATFVKLHKVSDVSIATKPFTHVHPVDLQDIKTKDQFQLICYEHNNIAFFGDKVVLVEGDSDYLVLPHIAHLINPEWGPGGSSVRFARINGKGSIRRYRKFFEKFGSIVRVIADLDLLIDGFEQLDAPAEIFEQRSILIDSLDQALKNYSPQEASAKSLKEAQERSNLKAIYQRAKHEHEKVKEGSGSFEAVLTGLEEFFAWERDDGRLRLLKNPPNEHIRTLRNGLLRALRNSNVFVLARGAIEDYYPPIVTGNDKPSKAQALCNSVTTREAALALCDDIEIDGTGHRANEFEAIFTAIFG